MTLRLIFIKNTKVTQNTHPEKFMIQGSLFCNISVLMLCITLNILYKD